MKKRYIVALVLLALVAWWVWARPVVVLHYRMTVSVDTPEGVKSGSAVRRVIISWLPKILPDEHGASVVVKGEAVMVDLGARGMLFALLRGNSRLGVDYGQTILADAFPVPVDGEGAYTRVGRRYYSQLGHEKRTLGTEQYPMMVRFRDINDPKTIEDVYARPRTITPENRALAKRDPFEIAFGEGVKLKEITIEITDDPVTTGVRKILPSFGQGSGFDEWQRTLPYGNPLRLDLSDFVKGSRQ